METGEIMANTVFKKQMLMEFKRLLMSSNTLKMLPFNFYITVFAYLKLDWTTSLYNGCGRNYNIYIYICNTQQFISIKCYPTHMISLHYGCPTISAHYQYLPIKSLKWNIGIVPKWTFLKKAWYFMSASCIYRYNDLENISISDISKNLISCISSLNSWLFNRHF